MNVKGVGTDGYGSYVENIYNHKMDEKESVKKMPADKFVDEYIPGNPPRGIYSMGKDDEGNPKIDYLDFKDKESAETSGNDKTKSESTTTDTDMVDREIERLKEKKKQLEQQANNVQDLDKKEQLEKEIARIDLELAEKDNDAYRRQHAVIS